MQHTVKMTAEITVMRVTNIQKGILENRGTSLRVAVLSIIFGREQGLGVSVFRCFIFPAEFPATCSLAQSTTCQAHLQVLAITTI